VEHFEQFKEALEARAHCFFAGKGDRDGCALFVPKARFAVVGEPEKVVLVPMASQVALIARLRDVGSGRIVLVACTHFKAKHGFEELRQRQAKALCEAIEHRKQPGDVVLVGGDFNDEPTSLACEEMRKHGYRSAYATLNLESYSTSKIRESVSERCIDYIWFDPGALTPLAVLEIPTAESLGPTKLPLAGFPSDHLSIATEFSFK
jgi:nocturnin